MVGAESLITEDAPVMRPVGELVTEYVALRDHLKDRRKEFKDFEAQIKGEMEQLEAAILERQRELGVTSLSTEVHTAFQTEKTYVRVGNWDKFIEYILLTKNTQCLEKRCAKLACLEIFNSGGVSPDEIGLTKDTEIAIQVRKK